MDISVPYLDPVKEDLIRTNDWGLLWGGNLKQGTSSVGSLAAEIGSALVLLSISSPPLEGHTACIVEKDKEGKEVFAKKEKYMGAKLTSKPKYKENEELRNCRSILSIEADVNEKKKISDMAMDENPTVNTSLKLSAIKGSREKQGIRVEKLSVSWAADVYDPPVTSQSHTLTNDNQHGSTTSKKSHRNKNKSKSSRKNNSEKKKGSKISRNSSKVAGY